MAVKTNEGEGIWLAPLNTTKKLKKKPASFLLHCNFSGWYFQMSYKNISVDASGTFLIYIFFVFQSEN